jgi:biopolymer transport protein ExbB
MSDFRDREFATIATHSKEPLLMHKNTFRIALFAAALIVALSMVGGQVFAQAAEGAAAAGEAPVKGKGVTAIILENVDFVFVLIGILSVVALTFIIQGFIRVRSEVMMPQATTDTIREMINNRQYQELIDFTEADPSFVAKAINPALKRAPNYSSMKEALEISVGEQTADSFRKIEILNIVGNMGPLLGLMGTVLGMIEAFSAMNAAGGNANPAVLAGGISKALAHTFLGLFLAIPALMGYGILRQMTDKLTTRAAIVSEELLSLMKPGESKPNATPARPQPVASR